MFVVILQLSHRKQLEPNPSAMNAGLQENRTACGGRLRAALGGTLIACAAKRHYIGGVWAMVAVPLCSFATILWITAPFILRACSGRYRRRGEPSSSKFASAGSRCNKTAFFDDPPPGSTGLLPPSSWRMLMAALQSCIAYICFCC